MGDEGRTFTDGIREMLMLKTNSNYAALVAKMIELHEYVEKVK